jgi:hypothetical protein
MLLIAAFSGLTLAHVQCEQRRFFAWRRISASIPSSGLSDVFISSPTRHQTESGKSRMFSVSRQNNHPLRTRTQNLRPEINSTQRPFVGRDEDMGYESRDVKHYVCETVTTTTIVTSFPFPHPMPITINLIHSAAIVHTIQ